MKDLPSHIPCHFSSSDHLFERVLGLAAENIHTLKKQGATQSLASSQMPSKKRLRLNCIENEEHLNSTAKIIYIYVWLICNLDLRYLLLASKAVQVGNSILSDGRISTHIP